MKVPLLRQLVLRAIKQVCGKQPLDDSQSLKSLLGGRRSALERLQLLLASCFENRATKRSVQHRWISHPLSMNNTVGDVVASLRIATKQEEERVYTIEAAAASSRDRITRERLPQTSSPTLDGSFLRNQVSVKRSRKRDVTSSPARKWDIQAAAGSGTKSRPAKKAASLVQHQGQRGKSSQASDPPRATLVEIFYATNRMQLVRSDDRVRYGYTRGDQLSYGRCSVSIPPKHKIGQLESPSLLKFEFRADPSKHITVVQTTTLKDRQFFEKVKREAETRSGDILLFVHGYNVSFDDAAKSLGQLTFDLKFLGVPVLFSWPSANKALSYLHDGERIDLTLPVFKAFLQQLCACTGVKKVSILAHSMGNRLVCGALHEMGLEGSSNCLFGHIVCAAPDLSAAKFRQWLPKMSSLTSSMNLYQSSQDKALLASRKVNGEDRAGYPVLVEHSLSTIDASSLGDDLLRHSYVRDNYPLIGDLFQLLKGVPPEQRFALERRTHSGLPYYAFAQT